MYVCETVTFSECNNNNKWYIFKWQVEYPSITFSGQKVIVCVCGGGGQGLGLYLEWNRKKYTCHFVWKVNLPYNSLKIKGLSENKNSSQAR